MRNLVLGPVALVAGGVSGQHQVNTKQVEQILKGMADTGRVKEQD